MSAGLSGVKAGVWRYIIPITGVYYTPPGCMVRVANSAQVLLFLVGRRGCFRERNKLWSL